MKSSPCSPQLEKAHMQQRRPNAVKNKIKKKKKWGKSLKIEKQNKQTQNTAVMAVWFPYHKTNLLGRSPAG